MEDVGSDRPVISSARSQSPEDVTAQLGADYLQIPTSR